MGEPLRQLGRYELLRRIAVGGMGEIFVARSRGAGGFEKTVIIKTILPHLAEEEEFVEKFLDEGRIVVNLTHGNIVPVFDMGEDDGEYFIAMEYVRGRDLRAVLRALASGVEKGSANGAMPVEFALHITAEICKGLAYAHRKTDASGAPLGIVHRDVSPSNVLLSSEGEVKIIDFGIARAAGRLSRTASGRIQGKCCYMSPEQAQGLAVDGRSDIFSTGVLLYEMLTGVRPFEGSSDLESLDRVRRCEFDPPGVLNPCISPEVDAIVLRAMARDPDARYASIDQMQVDLLQQLYGSGQPVTSQQLADFLAGLFPRGVEPEELRAIGGAASRPRNLDLDAALNLELDRLASSDTDSAGHSAVRVGVKARQQDVDPLIATGRAPRPAEADQLDATRTLSGPRTPAETSAEIPAETPAEIPAERQAETPSPVAVSEGARSGAHPLVEDGGLANGAPQTGTHARRVSGFKRWIAVALTVGLVVGAVGVVFAIGNIGRTGEVYVESEPPGARIVVNGSQLVDARTPHTFELDAGRHTIQLVREGYEPLSLALELKPGERRELRGADVRLLAAEADDTRRFTVRTTPEGAVIEANGEPLGPAPQTVELGARDVVNLVATHPGCAPSNYTLSHSHSSDAIQLTLRCTPRLAARDGGEGDDDRDATTEAADAPGSGAQAARPRPAQAPTAPAPRRTSVELRIDSDPPGATIEVDGRPLGAAPLATTAAPDAMLRVRASLNGHEPVELVRRVSELDGGRLTLRLEPVEMGCLDFRALYPAHNELAIDGRWLDGRHMKLQRHALPVGKHSITVRNREVGKEETFGFTVEPGPRCTTLVVWEP